ncbi:precorrin-6A synthase (deacetylating) [Marinobacter nanhaiticus D15-8W]|uniref:Precorrin-6A synthase (Deacetylating) n=1 Tax=Marinobacter nanhaiticus D15-8W TaxID=626887 RepID=N6WRG6_9GAMM|nr:precorrin-6A synthase (deacetylating) [Marinobacter nanhaiticus]ENO14151.1 precorrin-6A synthase (deacetylating) [Marinobacter nanhaiticus D15-8W]BES71535.1 precorrin-6A synthase (deacetylating) [Marinobacter nanhaiticus D15-8W]
MIELSLIGIGTGNPDQVTLAAVRALNEADLILLPRKGEAKADLVDLRRMLCQSLLEPEAPVNVVEFDLPVRDRRDDYLATVDDWHDAISAVWGELIDRHLSGSGRVALMIWGDPSLYDSSLRIAGRLQSSGRSINLTVVPGITSLQVLTAEHRIPLNSLAEPVQITTGRRLREDGWPGGVNAVAVMLDGGGAFTVISSEDVYIWWGAYLGMDKQCLIEGRLADVADRILERRAELRRQHGWIMDIYLLKRDNALVSVQSVRSGDVPDKGE